MLSFQAAWGNGDPFTMGLTLQEQLVALFVSFLTLNTIAVGLRLYVRLRLQSSAFGWDDVFLTITYVSLNYFLFFIFTFFFSS